MATSKTLTPTNVTIQIPEFTDQPDQRANSNCIDKEADAINTLNTNITNVTNQLTVEHVSTGVAGVDAWRYGKTMVVNISDIIPSSFTSGEIWTAPSGYRPGATFRSIARAASAGSTARLSIGTSNYKLSIVGATDQNTAYYGQIMWIINS